MTISYNVLLFTQYTNLETPTQRRCEMKTVLLYVLFVLLVCVITSVITSPMIFIFHGQQIRAQQRQDDQLCQMMVSFARLQGATDQTNFQMGKEYCFFFADYERGIAILGEFDHGISYDKTPRIIIMGGVSRKCLEDWNSQPALYSRYKKIR